MTDDIVTRLREQMQGCDNRNCEGCEVEAEAVDEIERLREQIRQLEADRDRWAKWGEHVLICPNKGKNLCRDCISPAIKDAISRVEKEGNLIDRFVNTRKWDVEDANKWKTSDDNRYHYDIE